MSLPRPRSRSSTLLRRGFYDEFATTSAASTAIGSLGWKETGTTPTVSQLAGVTNHPGLLKLATAGSSPNTVSVSLDNGTGYISNADAITNGGWEMRWAVQVNNNDAGACGTNCEAYYFGLMNSASTTTDPGALAAGVQGIYIRFDPRNGDTAWTAETHNSGTTCTQGTPGSYTNCTITAITGGTVTGTTHWYILRLRSSVGGTILFSVNVDGGTYTAETSITTTLPSVTLVPEAIGITTLGNAAPAYTMDAFWYLQSPLAR